VLAGQLFSEVDSHLHDRGDRTADRASRYLVSSVGPIAELVTALDHVAQLAHIRCGLRGSLQRFGEFLRWCHPVEGLSRPPVE
jgi:hypothetical protein